MGVDRQRRSCGSAREHPAAQVLRNAQPPASSPTDCTALPWPRDQCAFAAPGDLRRSIVVEGCVAIALPDREDRQFIKPRPPGGSMRPQSHAPEIHRCDRGGLQRRFVTRDMRLAPEAVERCDAGEVGQLRRRRECSQELCESRAIVEQRWMRRQLRTRVNRCGSAQPLFADQTLDSGILACSASMQPFITVLR